MYTIAQTYIAAILVMQENRHKKNQRSLGVPVGSQEDGERQK